MSEYHINTSEPSKVTRFYQGGTFFAPKLAKNEPDPGVFQRPPRSQH